ncbi:VanW family protein [Kineosporia sp. J2-2]|uniref:VanW family protein n=1 Tax=Kineosporia corallincola TaxID=2835133 RepID=A0ABS5TJ52_9ACTN|nr:VanW family protein [Kineosporia corallincola]MBT0770429.1 VanW family protein [Kineosporia corallincola]
MTSAPAVSSTSWNQPSGNDSGEGPNPNQGQVQAPGEGPGGGNGGDDGDGGHGGGDSSGRSRRLPGGRRGLLVGAVALGGALAAYLGVALLNADRVAQHTTVAGVEVGGLTRSETVNTLTKAYQDLDGQVLLTAAEGQHEQRVDVADLKVELDAEEVAGRLTGFTLNPVSLVRHMTGGKTVDPVPAGGSSDPVEAGLESFREKATRPAQDASITFDGTTPEVQASQEGYEVSATGAAAAVRGHWLTGTVEVPVEATAPRYDTAAAEALKTPAQTAVSAPLTIRVGETDVELQPSQYVSLLSTRDDDGELGLFIDGKKLKKLVLKEEPGIQKKATDARIVVKNGKPSVVADENGLTVDEADLAVKARDSMLHDSAPDRIAVVSTKALKAELTAAEAEKLGVRERISTFSTNLTSDAQRTENLRVAARTVDGTLVLPGETFSLNETLGERTPEKGYNQAPAISGGRLVQDYGGGVSQMATTIFNNVFFSGLKDVYHKPHSFYISRYPEGREATVNWPTVDMKWKNDTDTAVLIKASVGSQVTVSFYGTKYWDVSAGKSERSNYRTPKTVYDDSAGCVAQGANQGFDVSVTRTFRKPGSDEVAKTETFHAVYNAEDEVICGPEPGSEDDQADDEKSGDAGDQADEEDAGDQPSRGGGRRPDHHAGR